MDLKVDMTCTATLKEVILLLTPMQPHKDTQSMINLLTLMDMTNMVTITPNKTIMDTVVKLMNMAIQLLRLQYQGPHQLHLLAKHLLLKEGGIIPQAEEDRVQEVMARLLVEEEVMVVETEIQEIVETVDLVVAIQDTDLLETTEDHPITHTVSPFLKLC